MNQFRKCVLIFYLSLTLSSVMGCSSIQDLKTQVENAMKQLEEATKQVEEVKQQIINVHKKIEDDAEAKLEMLQDKLRKAEARALIAEAELEAKKNELNKILDKEKEAVDRL